MPAARTGLRRIGRIHTHHCSASFLRFVEQLCEKCRPCRIGDTLSKVWVLDQVAHHQRFHRDQPEAFDERGHLLPDEVLPPPPDPFMHSRHHLAPFFPLGCPFVCTGELAVGAGQGLFLLAEEAWIGYLFSGREIGKRGKADVDADLRIQCRPRLSLRLTFHADRDKPFAGRGAFHCRRLGQPFQRSMHYHLEVPQLREDEGAFASLPLLHVEAVVVLLESEARVARVRAEARIARPLAFLDTLEEAIKGPIHPLEDVLQDLRVHLGQFRTHLFAGGQLSALVRVANGYARHAVGIPALLQRSVIGLTAERKPLLQSRSLFFGWVEPVLKGLVHLTQTFFLEQAQSETSTSSPHEGTRLSSP
jgi:hypothetical protein